MVAILRIEYKMQQGITTPYLCECEDRVKYVVKGTTANYNGLVNEYICAEFGREFELPIPKAELAYVDESLIEFTDFSLSSGYCFASKFVGGLQEITFNQLPSLNKSMLKNLYVFDYWIRNNDRSLTVKGGNPNLFYNMGSGTPVVLDHNLAFDKEFSLEQHKNLHLASGFVQGLDLCDRQYYENKMNNCMEKLPDLLDKLPEEWMESYSLDRINEDIVVPLKAYREESFWEGIK